MITRDNRLGHITLIEYSKKSIAIVGETYEHRKDFKQAGGKYNRYLRVEGKTCSGWIFSVNRRGEINNILDHI